MTKPNHLSNEVSIAVRVEIPGIPNVAVSLGTRSRFVSAIDRLLGGIPDLGGAYLDGLAAKKRARDAAEIDLINEQGKAALASAYNNPSFGAEVAKRFLEDQARKQINCEGVALSTIEHIQGSDDPGEEAGVLDDDWLNVFAAAAENASSERLRDMWGRVLSGEIKRPGSFSLPTLRFVAELDYTTGTTFEKYIATRLDDGRILRPDPIAATNISELVFLESIGLIYGFGSDTLVAELESKENTSINLVFGNISLYMKMVAANETYKLRVMYITRVGRELLQILPPPQYELVAREVWRRLDQSVNEAELREVVERSERSVTRWKMIEKLK